MIFLQKIQDDITWRMGELGILKSLMVRHELQETHRIMLTRYLVPAIYALWEGFVKNSFASYANYLNSKKLRCCEVHINILTYAIEVNEKLRLRDSRTNLVIQREFVETYNDFYESPLHLGDKVLTNDNVNFQVINVLLDSFNLESLSESMYKNKLNRLLCLRNEVAHGGKTIPIKIEDIETYSQLVIDLMADVMDKMEQGIRHQTYLKNRYRHIHSEPL